ncbi:hypothetical protein AAVH_09897 [Aphelenchoides avenae]|nr:hypothetical protein AAVH_09897 [Aphelenchus avenae]
MRITSFLFGNLNKVHWDQRVWEIGYRGSPLPKRKATRRPHIPVTKYRVDILRERFKREWNVMRWLATPYLNEEIEKPYIEKHGDVHQQLERERERAQQARMPGDEKWIGEHGKANKRYANYGNLLHHHRTVEDSMGELIRRNRWD